MEHQAISKERTGSEHPEEARCDDAELLARFRRGDDAAFLELFARHNASLHLYCLKIIGDYQQAEDFTQETWERVIALRANTRVVSNPISLLFRIARNLCIDYLRRRKRLVLVSEFDESAIPLRATADPSELEETALAALEQLPFEYREVLVLNLYCGYGYDEIAVMLDKTSEAIWARASRGRARLRKMVAAAIGSTSDSTTHTPRTIHARERTR